MENPRRSSLWRRHAIGLARALRDDARATALVEGALLMPVALLTIALLIYGAEGFAVNRKVSMTARTVTDLITQATPTQYSNGSSVMTEAAIDNLLQVASAVLAPYSASNMTMVVSQVLVQHWRHDRHGHLERALQRRDGEARRPGSHAAGHDRDRPGRQLLRVRRSLLQLHPAEFLRVAEPDDAVRLDLSDPASVNEHHLLELRDAVDRPLELTDRSESDRRRRVQRDDGCAPSPLAHGCPGNQNRLPGRKSLQPPRVMAGLVPRLFRYALCLKRRTALILLGSEGFATHLDMKRISAMRHQNSVFHGILKFVPWAVFDRLVEKHGSDELVRKFTTSDQLIGLAVWPIFRGRLVARRRSDHGEPPGAALSIGGRRRRPLHSRRRQPLSQPAGFCRLFAHMLGMTTRAVRRRMGEAVRLINSTSLPLAGVGAQWARFSADVCGAKAPVVYDPDLGRPVYHAVTAANGQRHHRRQANAHRARRHLCLRFGLLRLRLVGEAPRSRLPDRHALQEQHAAARRARPCRWNRERAFCPTGSASCPVVRPRTGRTRCRTPCGRSW